jgi:hypothetical protein
MLTMPDLQNMDCAFVILASSYRKIHTRAELVEATQNPGETEKQMEQLFALDPRERIFSEVIDDVVDDASDVRETVERKRKFKPFRFMVTPQPVNCDLCGLAFTSLSNLNAHKENSTSLNQLSMVAILTMGDRYM